MRTWRKGIFGSSSRKIFSIASRWILFMICRTGRNTFTFTFACACGLPTMTAS
nr:MAG TPA: hypothetical protein [Caudoviricetes sp.]